MRLLRTSDLAFEEFLGEEKPQYAILSHTWEQEEVSYHDMVTGRSLDKAGYAKIERCCAQAALEGYSHVWVDTCCINKDSSAELSEAINSMYRWYQDAAICYAYLADVSDDGIAEPDISKSRWFTRGWTLQELVAPRIVVFFSSSWKKIATKDESRAKIARITGIHQGVLDRAHPCMYSVAQRMSWASKRQTTRVEDMAYCLMGIFDINMPLLYGEGPKAFVRLQMSILNEVDDHSIFAWTDPTDNGQHRGLLAHHPYCFEGSRNVIKTKPDSRHLVSRPFSATNVGLRAQFELSPCLFPRGLENTRTFFATLDCGLMAHTGIAVLLERISGTGDQFGRVGCRRLEFRASNGVRRGNLETIYVRQNMRRPDHRPNSKPYGVWMRTLPSSSSGYTLHSAVPLALWNTEQRVLRFPYGTGRMGSLVFHHKSKPNLIVTFGYIPSKESLRIRVDQCSGDILSTPDVSPLLLGESRTETLLQCPKWVTVTSEREIVLGCDVFVVVIEVDKQESSFDMLYT